MADLQKLIDTADELDFNLTGQLRDADVEQLVKHWRPWISFHELERFHPIAFEDFLEKPQQVFDLLQEPAREELRLVRWIENAAGLAVLETFDPPILTKGLGFREKAQPVSADDPPVPTSQVLGSADTVLQSLELEEADKDAVITNGTSYRSARQLFGASDTVAGNPEPAPTDPREPRWDMKVIAEFKMLLETLEYELRVEREDYPDDALRGGFEVLSLFFSKKPDDTGVPGGSGGQPATPTFLPRSLMVEVLLQLIEGHRAGSTAMEQAALDLIPDDWQFNFAPWEAIKRFAFIEYYLFYTYNDFDQYATWPWENRHEGDIEGFCLVFERAQLENAVQDGTPLVDVRPLTIITSVHEEFQDADRLRHLDQSLSQEEFRQAMQVYVAVGSHATYLKSGSHDHFDFSDSLTAPFQTDSFLIDLLALVATLSGITLLVAIAEHFVGTDDETSDQGIIADSDELPNTNPDEQQRVVRPETLHLPLSSQDHIYAPQSPGDLARLAVRAFAGKWGGHNEIKNKSWPHQAKTGRYFRKLLPRVQPVID
jgi:hypothetical protein